MGNYIIQNTNAELIKQAMHELAKHYQDDKSSPKQQLTWVKLLLERTKDLLGIKGANLGSKTSSKFRFKLQSLFSGSP